MTHAVSQIGSRQSLFHAPVAELLHVTSTNLQPEVTLATVSCNFSPLDFNNIDKGTIISDLQELKNEVRDLQQESLFNKTLFNQLTEVRSINYFS